MKKNIMVLVAGIVSVASDCFGLEALEKAKDAYTAKVNAASVSASVSVPRSFIKVEGQSLFDAASSFLSGPEILFFKLGAWASQIKDGGIFAGSVFTFYTMLRSEKFGAVGEINQASVTTVGLHNSLKDFLKSFAADGSFGNGEDDHSADGIVSLYANFANDFGNNHVSTEENYKVVAKNNGDAATARRKVDLVGALGEEISLTAKGTKKQNLFLHILALTEIAESGTLNDAELDGEKAPVGYTKAMADKVFGLLKAIMS